MGRGDDDGTRSRVAWKGWEKEKRQQDERKGCARARTHERDPNLVILCQDFRVYTFGVSIARDPIDIASVTGRCRSAAATIAEIRTLVNGMRNRTERLVNCNRFERLGDGADARTLASSCDLTLGSSGLFAIPSTSRAIR